MKQLVYALLVLITVTVACNKTEDEPTGVEKEISWIMGAEMMTEAIFDVPISSSGKAFLEISAYSICASEALQISVSSASGAFLLNRQPETNIIYELETPAESEFLIIQASLIPHRIDINCVTAGSAVITYRYVN